MTEQIKPVFINILLVAEEMSLPGNTVFAFDGCKLPSNAGKEQSGTFDDLRKKQQKLKDKITTIINNHKALDSHSQSELPPSKQKASAHRCCRDFRQGSGQFVTETDA